MTRTSKDGSQKALLVYNLKNTAETVKLDLSGSGLSLAQTPRDLLRGKTMPAITGASYELALPAYGYELLEVQ